MPLLVPVAGHDSTSANRRHLLPERPAHTIYNAECCRAESLACSRCTAPPTLTDKSTDVICRILMRVISIGESFAKRKAPAEARGSQVPANVVALGRR